MPDIEITSNIGPNELGPIQPNAPLMYQKLHRDLENWSIYRLLPQLIQFDRALNSHLTNVQKGLTRVPDFYKEMAPQTLWAYYQTLPQWCRESSAVKHLLFAFEYNKPFMDFRQKELAMNYMCSLLGPIEGRLLEVINEVA